MTRDANGQNRLLLRRTITHAFDFRGRSRRSEIVFYWIASLLLSTVLSFVILGLGVNWIVDVTRLLLFVPTVSLYLRRLHDQNRSAVWMLPWAIVVIAELAIGFVYGQYGVMQTPRLLQLALAALSLVILVLALLPGTAGPNRFGPDPREEETRTALAQ